MPQTSTHCIRTQKVYDWVSVPGNFTTTLAIPNCTPTINDEVCGNFSTPPLEYEVLWESLLSVSIKGTVTICLTRGSFDDVEIAVNNQLILPTNPTHFSETFQSLTSLSIRLLNPNAIIYGRFCLELNYQAPVNVNEPVVEDCFLSDEHGNKITYNNVNCIVIGDRTEQTVLLPSGEIVELYEILIRKEGFIGIQLEGAKCVCVLEFDVVEKLLLCAPPGTEIQCKITDFSCLLRSIVRYDHCWCLEFDITICQEIQSLFEVVVSLDAEQCLPRKLFPSNACSLTDSPNTV